MGKKIKKAVKKVTRKISKPVEKLVKHTVGAVVPAPEAPKVVPAPAPEPVAAPAALVDVPDKDNVETEDEAQTESGRKKARAGGKKSLSVARSSGGGLNI